MASLPTLMVLQVKGRGWVKHGKANAVVVENGEGVFDPLSKIEVERSKSYPNGYVHLRFCQSNKYWERSNDGSVVANATKPEEDTSKPSCTLFQYVAEGGFRHVESGGHVKMNDSNNRMCVVADPKVETGFAFLTILDLERHIKLPKHVAFRGRNDKYLQVYGTENHLQFSSDDATATASGFQTYLLEDGSYRIKSDYYNKFWRLGTDNWICADSDDDGPGGVDTHFWPVRISRNIIALKSESNQMFCGRSLWYKSYDYLKAEYKTDTKETWVEIEELS